MLPHAARLFRYGDIAQGVRGIGCMNLKRMWSGIRSLRLRTKLTLAFLLVASMVSGAGGFGLFYIKQATQTAAIFSEVTAPIVHEAFTLIESLQTLHITLLQVFDLRDVESHQAYVQALAAFETAFPEGLARIQQLAATAQLHLALEDVVQQERVFIAQASYVLAAHQTKVVQAAMAEQQLRRFEVHRKGLESLLTTFIYESEAMMAVKEDRGKTLTQSSEATAESLQEVLAETLTESYPIVRGAYKLMRYLIQMQDTARAYIMTDEPAQLATLEGDFQKSLKTATMLLKHLTNRLQNHGATQTITAVQQSVAQLQALVLAENGLFATHRAALTANLNAEARTLKDLLNTTSRHAEQALQHVTKQAEALNAQARGRAHAAAQQSQTNILLVIVIGLIVAAVVGTGVARAVTRPLSEAVRALQRIAGGDLTGDIHVYTNDETGQLLQSMRVMQAKLAGLYGTLETRLTRLHALTSLNHLISASLDMQVVLQEIANAAATLMTTACVRIWTIDETTIVESGHDALTALAQARATGNPFALVLLDAQMPEMDGFSVAAQMQQDPALAGTTILMLSSTDLAGDAVRCRALGIGLHLMKPIAQVELWDAIMLVLSRREPARSALRPAALPTRLAPHGPLRILLAEDNAVNQKVAMRMLEKHGHSVTVVGDGHAALAALAQASFDLVLMDVQMPGMDGLEATAVIREQERMRGTHLPIIALTASAMQGDREKCLAAGMDSYVVKPLQAQDLYAAMEQLLSEAAS